MAMISNYSELKSELSAYLFHQRLANRYDNCTRMFEAAANRRLRVYPMEAVDLLTTVNGVTALPSEYLAWRTVLWTGRTPFAELDYVHPAYLQSTYVELEHGNPKLFTIEGTGNNATSPNVKIRPVNDTANAYEFHYYHRIPSIVDNARNWLLDSWPDAYLFGVLTELSAVQRNAEMAQLYKARRDETFAEIIQLSALTTGATSSKVRTAEYF